jgi:hypothetical protein
MSAELLAAIEEQCETEGNKKRSPFLAEIMELLLLSPAGQELRASAKHHRRPLLHELEANLILQHLPEYLSGFSHDSHHARGQ